MKSSRDKPVSAASSDRERLERKIDKFTTPPIEFVMPPPRVREMKRDSNAGGVMPSSAKDKMSDLHKYLSDVESEVASMSDSNVFRDEEFEEMKYRQQGAFEKQRSSISSSRTAVGKQMNADHAEGHAVRSQFAALANELTVTRLEVDEANKTIEVLKELLSREQASKMSHETSLKERYEKLLSDQKEELETVIDRHLTFIDQLISDKNDLSSQIGSLTAELRGYEESAEEKIRELTEKFQREMKTSKDVWAIAEKQRKEKWVIEKTAEIKEVTVRGLEPEIEKIINKSKSDIKKLEDKQTRQVLELRESVQEEYETKFRAYKERSVLEMEELISKERQFKSDRVKEQILQTEKGFAEDRERIRRQFEEELKNEEDKRRQESQYYTKKIKEMQDQHFDEIRAAKHEAAKEIENKRVQTSQWIEKQREELKKEMETILASEITKITEDMQKKGKETQRRLEKERDLQIEVIIAKFTEETEGAEKGVEKKLSKRIQQLQAQHKEDIQRLKAELEKSEESIAVKDLTIKYQLETVKQQSKQLEDQERRLQKILEDNVQLKKEVELERRVGSANDDQIKNHEEKVRREMSLEISNLSEKLVLTNKQLLALRATHEKQLEEAEDKHSKQLEAVEERVKSIVLKKEQQVVRLKEEVRLKEQSCLRLEQMLEKQRRDLMQRISH